VEITRRLRDKVVVTIPSKVNEEILALKSHIEDNTEMLERWLFEN
jgi:hypothetical protein